MALDDGDREWIANLLKSEITASEERMTGRMNRRFEEMDGRFDRLERQMTEMESRLGILISENGQAIADLAVRVSRLEGPEPPQMRRTGA